MNSLGPFKFTDWSGWKVSRDWKFFRIKKRSNVIEGEGSFVFVFWSSNINFIIHVVNSEKKVTFGRVGRPSLTVFLV